MPSNGQDQHLATISHEGRFWDVYVELDEQRTSPARGRLRFAAADQGRADSSVRTGYILVEASPEAVYARARALATHQLTALLRSCLP